MPTHQPIDYSDGHPMFSLRGKAVVVTGGGRGIGRGITRAMARAGADVVIAGRSEGPLNEAAEEVRALGRKAVVVATDITKMDDIKRLTDTALSEFGYIDGWVNNAGSANTEDVSNMMDMRESQWDHVVDLNLKWSFFCMQAAARAMQERGGSIVNISSRSGSQPCPMTGQYGAAKAGIENLTATGAVEWGHLGIRVNAISPGVVPVENSRSMTSTSRQRRQIETVPLRRLGHVDDIGPLAVYYVSDESSWISGTVTQATGGSRIPVGLLTYLYKVNKAEEEKEFQASRDAG